MLQGRLSAALAAAVALIAPAVAKADSFTVTGTADGGQCAGTTCPSIRAALDSAGDGDTIVVGPGEHRLTQGPLSVLRDVTIVGAGAQHTTVVGDLEQGVRVFDVGTPSLRPRVTIAHVTMARGAAFCSDGGNLRNYGTLRLHHVRVTGGLAARGGGIGNSGSLSLEHSLVDGNAASSCDGGDGGGIYSEGTLSVSDSTVVGNFASTGGGIVVVDTSQSEPRPVAARLTRVTIARNRTYTGAGGLLLYSGARVLVAGSILAENTIDPPTFAAAAPEPSNCGRVIPEDGGGNLVDHADCGFLGLPAPPRLGELTPGAGGTPVLAIAPDSPAVDRAGACEGTDQRDLPRPQGAACDAGAYEVAVPPAIESGPSGITGDASPAFAFSGAPAFDCRLDGPAGAGAWEPCASPKAYAALAPGAYVFRVRGGSGGAESARAFTVAAQPPAVQPTPVPPAPTQTPAPSVTPSPQYRRSVVVRPTSGKVRVRLPGTRRYVDLASIDSLPFGASVDARKGRVRLYAARNARGRVQAASFYGGVFRIRQRGRYVDLQLRGPKPTCRSARASTSADKPKKKKRKARKRRLWGSGKGKFRTSGRYSAATVRGTKWLVEDRCRSTLTRVTSGVVTVRDFKRKRTIRLRAGDRYIARRR